MHRYELSKRKLEFAKLYLDFERRYSSALAGNAYRCALEVGYSESYAKRIMWHMSWVQLAMMAQEQGLILEDDTQRYVKEISERTDKC
jgi:hypothetical protein